jgi:tetratricopeptide (TPR) repeat protein
LKNRFSCEMVSILDYLMPTRCSISPARCLGAVVICITVGIFARPAISATPPATPTANDELSVEQARLADRYTRLEAVLSRLAELSANTDPRRARLLREAIAKSREQDINHRFDSIVKLLEQERLSAASDRQTDLEQELSELLTLLLKADRDQQLASQRQQVKKYLQEVGKLIRKQKGINARTEGGDDPKHLSKEQGDVAEETGKLGGNIRETEHRETDVKPKDGKDAKSSDTAPKDGAPKDGARKDDKQGKPSDGKPAEGKPSDGNDSKGSPSAGKPSEGKPSDGKPSDGKPSDGKRSDSDGKQSPQQGQPGSSPPSEGQSSGESEPQPQQPQAPADRAADRLKAAQEQMERAKKKLDDAEREGATADQRKALDELEQAKAELERILRQLREEEMERTLTLLAARFRKMLDAQQRVYDSTVRLDKVPKAQRGHDEEIESARLSREEQAIATDADRALVLLKEEGSSVAFPETISLMREDMQKVVERLAEVKTGEFTQGLEQDIIEALEETIAALQQAIKDLDKKRTPPGQSPAAGQQPDPPLVDKIAELKMIRSLQMRINRRTQRYGKLIEGEQAEAPEIIQALSELAERQQRVFQATDDLSQNRND